MRPHFLDRATSDDLASEVSERNRYGQHHHPASERRHPALHRQLPRPRKRQRRKSFRRKGEAEAFRHTVDADKLRGTYLDLEAGRVKFREYAAEWLEGRTFDRSTYEATEVRLRVHVLPVLGNLQLRHIKPSTIQKLLRSMDLSDT